MFLNRFLDTASFFLDTASTEMFMVFTEAPFTRWQQMPDLPVAMESFSVALVDRQLLLLACAKINGQPSDRARKENYCILVHLVPNCYRNGRTFHDILWTHHIL